jgi:hypothetical protein
VGSVSIYASVDSTSETPPRDDQCSQDNVGPEKILSNTPRNEEPTPWPINQILPMTCNRNIGSF